ncbi:hypothetical protein ACO3VM_02735 [Methanocaldococcus sp. 10A]
MVAGTIQSIRPASIPIEKSNKIFITQPMFIQVLELDLQPNVPSDTSQPATFTFSLGHGVSFPLYPPVIYDPTNNNQIFPQSVSLAPGNVAIIVDRNAVDASKTYKIYCVVAVPKTMEFITNVYSDNVDDVTPDHPMLRLTARILLVKDTAPESFEIVVEYSSGRREIFTINKNALVEYNPNSDDGMSGDAIKSVE